VTLMRTTAEECAQMGRWIGGRLNEMEGPVASSCPKAGSRRWMRRARRSTIRGAQALFDALEATVRQTSTGS
jgi:uncharacterized protein (UPF0261 family)